ncbi:MAG: HAMP domain-containing protein [Planctomycetes bacterium]|nr:HAMP domain-containing protein [Planctomycetota bacterium]
MDWHHWIRRLRDLSIRNKLILFGTMTAAAALLLAGIVFIVTDVQSMRRNMVHEFRSLADILSSNLVAAVTFDDAATAQELLGSVQREPSVLVATVFDRNGQVFAQYRRQPEYEGPQEKRVSIHGHVFTSDGYLLIATPINDGDETIGTLQLRVSMDRLSEQVTTYASTAAAVLFLAMGASVMFATVFQGLLSRPIRNLAEVAARVSDHQDFSIRVQKPSSDEVGDLYDAFNHMLEQIEAGQHALQDSYEQLEVRVIERTQQLMQANEELRREIVEREKAERKLRGVQEELVETAHRAGMAEIATGVLHNVGNVLTSVNVSSNLAMEKIRRLGVQDMVKVAQLLEEHQDDLGRFMTEDKRGRHLAPFLIELSQYMVHQEAEVIEELKSLQKNIDHIKEIIAVQQSHARMTGFVQEVVLSQIIDDAIQINMASMERHRIRIVRDYEQIPPVLAEKQKLMQILINLLSNAKHALRDCDHPDKRIIVRLKRQGEDRVRIEVEDNGVGINEENLTRIFAHGFTTKKDGHGFGLHGAALHAKEMGGSLVARSDGPGRGAVFTLEFPIKPAEKLKRKPTQETTADSESSQAPALA